MIGYLCCTRASVVRTSQSCACLSCMVERLCCARILPCWRYSVLPHCCDIERYVATLKPYVLRFSIATKNTRSRHKISPCWTTLSRHNNIPSLQEFPFLRKLCRYIISPCLGQLCRNIKYSVTTENILTLATLCRDIKYYVAT